MTFISFRFREQLQQKPNTKNSIKYVNNNNNLNLKLEKAINIEYGIIDFENVIIETVTSTRLEYRKR